MCRPSLGREIIEVHITNRVAEHSIEVLSIVTTRLAAAKVVEGISNDRTWCMIPPMRGIRQYLPFAGRRIDPVKPSLGARIMAVDDTSDNVDPAITMQSTATRATATRNRNLRACFPSIRARLVNQDCIQRCLVWKQAFHRAKHPYLRADNDGLKVMHFDWRRAAVGPYFGLWIENIYGLHPAATE